MLKIIFYYLIFSSVVLYYGVGLDKILTAKKDASCWLKSLFKSLVTTAATTALTFCLDNFVFSRLGISEIYPYFMALFFITVSYGLHRLIKTSFFDIAEDYMIPFTIVLISIKEGFTFFSTLLICVCGVFSFYIFMLLAFSIRNRFSFYQKDSGVKSFYILVMSLAVIFIALYGFNASWLALGLNS